MLHLYQDTPIGGGDALYAMADVNINNPEDGQMLVYDASTQRWRNVTQKSLNDLAEVTDLTNVIATGSTNATGATIPKGLYFYLNDDLCQAKADIASGATFTLNTNYEVVTAGGLNSLNSAIPYFIEKSGSFSIGTSVTYYDIPLNLSAEDYQNYKFANVSASDSAVRIYNSYVISNGSTLRVVANASQAVTVALKAVIVCQKAI